MKNKLLNTLNKLTIKNVFFGPQGFDVVSNDNDLKKAQQGHSTDLNGNDLLPKELGNWQASWLVFARDTELGDPYFVDVNDKSLAVYTAFHGDDGWQVELVSTSLKGFITCLNLLFEKNKQTSAQFIPDENTLVDIKQLSLLVAQLVNASGCEKFWTLFFDCYVDWLSEEDDDY